MSMSTHLVGIKPPDDDWLKMKAVWDACEAAGIAVPEDVEKFFDYTEPDPAGVVVDLDRGRAREWRAEDREGYELDIADLPAGVKTVRFYNAW